MAQELVRVRMLKTIDQYPCVLELVMGEFYDLPRENAERLKDAKALEFAPTKSSRLEAAALAAPSRRG